MEFTAARGLLFVLLVCSATALPAITQSDPDITDLFHEVKRETVTDADKPPLLKSPLFNPLLSPYGYFPPGKFGLPLGMMPPMTPSDILLNRFAKNATTPTATDPAAAAAPVDPFLMASYFKAKKDEFLGKLYEKIIASAAVPAADPAALKRQAVVDASAAAPAPAPAKPVGFFMGKKFDFLSKLFTSLNTTTPAPATDASSGEDVDGATATTTLKPTIVPPGFWIAGFPLPKTPKPTKAPKPPKPPKASKILKDALDSMLLESLLAEMSGDPAKDTSSTATRALPVPPVASKKAKAKKVKPEPTEITEYHIPAKVDAAFYEAKASDYLDKVFKALNKTTEANVTGAFVEPKATVIPLNFWTQPSQTEYTSKLDAFLDLLTKSLSAKPMESGSRKKRATFLDEFLHRIPPSTPEPAVEEESPIPSDDDEKKRSLIFRPFSPGIWMPSYLYAARMAAYMDALNGLSAAADPSDPLEATLKRAVASPDDAGAPPTGLSPKDAAINLIIADLSELKDTLVGTFAEGVKAQKDAAATTAKPSAAAKPFKKPLWGPKPTPTADPVAPIQKKIDVLNDLFDKLILLEKTLLGGDPSDPTTPPTEKSVLDATDATTTKPTIVPPSFWLPDASAAGSPDYYVTKTQEFLQKLYDSKSTAAPDDDA